MSVNAPIIMASHAYVKIGAFSFSKLNSVLGTILNNFYSTNIFMFIVMTLFLLLRKYNDVFLERRIDELFKVFTSNCFN